MSNNRIPLRVSLEHCITTLISPLNLGSIETSGFEPAINSFLNEHCSFGSKSKPDFIELISTFKNVGLLGDFRAFVFKVFPASTISQFDQDVQEYDLLLAIIDSDSNYYKKRLAVICKRLRITPDKLLVKLFYRYESPLILPLLPVEIGRVFCRPELQQKIFEVNFDVAKIQYLAEYGASDDKCIASFVLGEYKEIEQEPGRVSTVISSWLKQEYSTVCTNLEGVCKLLEAGKIKKNRFNYLLVLFHILSLLKEQDVVVARKYLLIYQNLLGINTLLRVLDICLDFQAGNIKRTKTKLKQLTFGLRGDRSEIFFRNLAYFWVNDQFTEKENFQLRQLREEAESSANKFIFSEVDALLKKSLSADALIKESQLFPNLKLCELFDSTESWDDLLNSIKDEKKYKLVWLLRLDSSSELQDAYCEIEPALAEIRSKNKLGSPKITAWRDLLKEQIDYELTDQDQKLLNLVQETDEDDRLSYSFPEMKALPYLHKAENVYLLDEPTQKIKIFKRSPEIEVGSYHKNFQVEWRFPSDQGTLHIHEKSDFHFDVCCLDDNQLFLRSKISSGLSLPKDFQKLSEFLESIKSNIIITGEEVLRQQKSGKLDFSQTKIVCRFNPSGAEYKLEILTCSNWGYETVPGYGKCYISEKLQGKFFEWHRDLDAEKELLNKALAMIGFESNSDCEFEIYDRQHLLEILEGLHGLKGLHLEWPRDLKVSAHKYSSGQLSVNATENKDWFKVEGKLQFGEVVVELATLLEKLNKKSRFIEISENQYVILTNELREQLTDISQLVDQRDEYLLLHSALAEQFDSKLNGVPVDLEEDILFKDAITRALYSKNTSVELPKDFKAELRPYQQTGFEWMARMSSQGIGVCLADDMGLGKTIQTLAQLSLKSSEGPSLVVAPTSLCTNWCSEGKKFAPELNFINYSGKDRQSLIFKSKVGDVFVVSYHILIYDCDLFVEKVWNTLVLDEAQMIKNSGTLRSKSIRLIPSNHRIALSGTPLENHTGELWNIFDILNPGLLGARAAFNKNFALPIERGDKEALKKLRSRVKPFLLRRLRKDVLNDLPESQESIIRIELSEEEKNLYDAHRYKAIKSLKKFRKQNQNRPQKRIEILAEITRLRVAAANPQIVDSHLEISTKSSALINKLINLSENGHKTLIFSQFVNHLNVVQNLLEKESIFFSRLDGSMNQKKRQLAIDAFTEGSVSCMLISLKAGGVGLNLTAADHVIHMDPWWNPAVEDQAVARAVRLGQKNKVNIIRFISIGTIEEDIIKLHESKRGLADELLKGTHAASKLSIEDLVQLIEKS